MTSVTEHDELRAAVRSFLDGHAPLRSEPTPHVWQRMCRELGLTGFGLADFAALAVVAEETGRVLLQAPYLSTAVAAVVLAEVGADDLLARLIDGSTTAALAVDGCRQVADAGQAGLLLVAGPDGLHAHEDFTATPLRPLDPTRPLADVELGTGGARQLGGPVDAALLRRLLLVALAAESVGAARECLQLTVEHLRVREQFGRPLGSFQALRHRVADLTVELEGATSTAWHATHAAAATSPELAVAAPLAKAMCSDAFAHIAGEMIQLHGGIGFTWEHSAHLYFKRAWTTRLTHGDSAALRREAFDLAEW